ncbi:hypothetical protein [Streptococcus cuniculi]|uniref:Uncharacterized protein n=1 Tax=Streptococcus cuniculi TaxID=1432788 RepID=A0A4Y9J9C2_9STRE|nr:hypothetical protein [Streptococcus cuniculi]MBF0778969.1 hypothetical protein [Streptococcus cuniculi]TFU97121.1 hypothetical protein E4T82_09585 [Streptococcus cuniculi]
MENKILYELPMFSALLSVSPEVEFKGRDVNITLRGYDDDDNFYIVILKFYGVFEFRKTYSHFANHGKAYDRVLEIINSDRLQQLKLNNRQLFNVLQNSSTPLRHFNLLLDSYDTYNIICSGFEVIDDGFG